MIVHFIIDEKVSSQIIDNFGRDKKNNSFLVFSQGNELTHLKGYEDRVRIFHFEKEDINEVLSQWTVSGILTHAMHLEYAEAINCLKLQCRLGWYTWGFDIYALPRIKPKTYAIQTAGYLRSSERFLGLRRWLLKSDLLRSVFYRFRSDKDRYSILFQAMKKLDFMATYLREDYDFFKRYYPEYKMKFVYAPFSTIDQYLAGNESLRVKSGSNNMLIGNSNSVESNHLDAFKRIAEAGQDYGQVYVPLSYGKDLNYRQRVLATGEERLGEQFEPLMDFMDRSRYLEILQSCSVGIFYHYRQQAMGNIMAMLYMGSRVYLSEKNPAFAFFSSNNIRVFSLEQEFQIYGSSHLEQTEAEANRKELNRLFGREEVHTRIDQLLEQLV